MTTFTKFWALKSEIKLEPGSTVEVNLKSGEKKPVAIGAYLGKKGDSYLYAPAAKEG